MASYTVKKLSGDEFTEGSLAYAIAQVRLGNIDTIVFDNSLANQTIDFADFGYFNASISFNNGTIINLNNTITLNSTENIAAITGNLGTKNINNCEGNISVTSQKDAVGINIYYKDSDDASTQNNNLNIDTLASSITSLSITSDAYGIKAFTSATGYYESTWGTYVSNGNGISNVNIGDITGHITITSNQKNSYGLYIVGEGLWGRGEAYISIKNITSSFTILGKESAYGIYVSAGRAAKMSIDDIKGVISVNSTDGKAYGLYSSGSICGNTSDYLSISGKFDIYGKAEAYIAYGNTVKLGIQNGSTFVLGTAYDNNKIAFYGKDTLDINCVKSEISIYSQGKGNAIVFASNNNANLSNVTSNINVIAQNSGNAIILEGKNVTINNVSNISNVISNDTGTAYGYSFAKGTISNYNGTLNITSQNKGYGFSGKGCNNNSFTNSNVLINVNSQEEAYGLDYLHSEKSFNEATINLELNNFAATLNVNSQNAASYGISVTTISNGISYGTYGDAHHGKGTSQITAETIFGSINVKANTNAYGIYIYGEGHSGGGYAILSTNTLSTKILAIGNESTYGIYAKGTSGDGGNINSDNLAGNIVAVSNDGESYGLYSSYKVVGKSKSSMTVSGVIISDSKSAYGIKAEGLLDIEIKGIVAAGNFETLGNQDKISSLQQQLENFSSNQNYADKLIRESKNSYALYSGAKNDNITIAKDALLLGSINLGTGTNTLNISTGAQIYGDIISSNLNLNFTVDAKLSNGSVIVSNSAEALIGNTTTYTINISNDAQSGRYILAIADDLSSLANKTFTVNNQGNTYKLTTSDDFEDNQYIDINIVNNKELELIVANTFFAYANSTNNNKIGKNNNSSITITFSNNLDTKSFSTNLVSLTKKDGSSINITSYSIDKNKLTLFFDPITQEGTYTLLLSEKIKNTEGKYLDQNCNKTYGEENDSYSLSLAADFTAPKVLKVTPEHDIAGTLNSVQIIFNESIDITSLKDNISLLTPNGAIVTPLSVTNISSNCIEVIFDDQTNYGEYQLKIGNQIMDLAGNQLDTNNNGIQGEAEDSYNHYFSITEIDLKVSNVKINKSTFSPGEKVNVQWDTFNNEGYALSGTWTDGIYLSTDTRWDINDIKLGELSHDGGLDVNESISNELNVNLAGVKSGTYYLLIRSDIYMQEKGDREPATAAQNLQAIEIKVEIPELVKDKTVTVKNVNNKDYNYFHFVQQANTSIKFNFDSKNESDKFEIYVGKGYIPTRQNFDYVLQDVTDGTLNVLASNKAENLYITVYSKNINKSTSFSITAKVPDVEITNITPSTQSMKTDSFFEIEGMNFSPDTVITLKDQNNKIYTPSATYFVNSSKMRFEFTSGELAAGKYDLCVSSNGKTVTKNDSITMVTGSGAQFTASLTTPDIVGYHIAATLTFDYSNTGFSSMDAPLVILNPLLYKEKVTNVEYFIDENGTRQVYTAAAYKAFEDRVRNATKGMTQEQINAYLQSKYYAVDNPEYVTISQDLSGESKSSLDESKGTVNNNFSVSVSASTAASDDEESKNRSEAIGNYLVGNGSNIFDFAKNSSTVGAIPKAHLYIGTIYTDKIVSAQTQDGAILTIDSNLQHTGFWTTNVPEGYTSSVSFLASGSNGLLLPGETGSIDIYYNGWDNDYWDYSYPPVKWNLSYITTDNKTKINWQEQLSSLNVSDQIKETLINSLTNSVGTTWGNYVKMLNSNMKFLADIGADKVEDTAELFQYELMQSIGYLSPVKTLESNEDVFLSSVGIPISISREYNSDLFSRDTKSSFGYGWNCSLDISLEIEADGDLIFQDNTNQIVYQLSAESSSSKTVYTIVSGDDGSQMVKQKNGYKLIKRDGTIYQFSSTGLLNSITDINNNVITYEYKQGYLTKLTHSSGQQVDITRNSDGTISSIKDHNNRILTYTYSNGNLIEVKDSLTNKSILYTYGQTHNLLSSTDTLGQVINYTYNSQTQLLEQISSHGGGKVVKVQYGSDGDVSITEPTGNKSIFYYNVNGQIARVDDLTTGITSHYKYDSYGNLESVQNTSLISVSLSNNAYGETLSEIDALNNTKTNTYDSNGRLTCSINERGNATEYTYDQQGNLIGTYYADGTSLTFTYDDKGNLTSMTNSQGNTSKYAYDESGNCTSITTDNGTTNYSYDQYGNLVSVTLNNNSQSYYQYDNMGNMTLFTDNNGNQTIYSYDNNGNLTSIKQANNAQEKFTFNSFNEQTSWTTARGTTVYYSYNSYGNLQSITNSDGTSYTYSYDSLNRLTGAGNLKFTYDNNDLLLTIESSNNQNISYTYDNLDRVISVSDGVNTTNYTYTEYGDIDVLTNSKGNLLADYDYDRFGKLSKITRGNGTSTLYTYNEYQELSEIKELDKNGNLSSYIQYTYNQNSQLLQMTTDEFIWTYTYDTQGQLIKAVQTSQDTQIVLHSEEYTYDKVGNRLTSTINNSKKSYIYNNMNQIVSCNGFTYRYDVDGNLIEDEERIYTWTADNKVATEKLKSTNQVWTYSYDAFGNRVGVESNGVKTTYTVDQNGNVIAEYVNGSFSKSYIHGNSLAGFVDAKGDTYYYTNDLLGSVTSVSNKTGVTVNNYTYDSFGNVLNSQETIANDFEYVGTYGLMSNSSGTIFVQARNYDPVTGRWISEDPTGIDGGENLYVYCNNNPNLVIDIDGEHPLVLIGLGAGVVVGLGSYLISQSLSGESITLGGALGSVVSGAISGTIYGATGGLALGGSVAVGAGASMVGNLVEQTVDNLWNKKPLSNIDSSQLILSGAWGAIGGLAGAGLGKYKAPKEIKAWGKRGVLTAKNILQGNGKYAQNFTKNFQDDGLLSSMLGWFQSVTSDQVNGEFKKLYDLIASGMTDAATELWARLTGSSGTHDPNDKLGPKGVGEEKYVASNQKFDYTVRFENDPEMANSPVKWVRVYDTLDSDFDISTLKLTEFNLAGSSFKINNSVDSYYDKVTIVVDGNEILVEASISLEYSEEIEAWQLIAEFMAIDPVTGTMLQDPMSGFLYPNDESGRGDGYISYSIELKKDVENKAKVDNMAEIYFDFNEPIDTPIVTNTVDSVAPDKPTLTVTQNGDTATIKLSANDNESGIAGYYLKYSLDGKNFYEYCVSTAETLTFAADGGSTYYFIVQAFDKVGNASAWSNVESITFTGVPTANAQKLTWDSVAGATGYIVECSTDNFEHYIRINSTNNSLDSFQLPAGNFQWRVRLENSNEWIAEGSLDVASTSNVARLVKSNEDGNLDIFFANPSGIWSKSFEARHIGSLNSWSGTKEIIDLEGKNKLNDIFYGSSDANILIMTDAENGDALFIDDIYSAMPGNSKEQLARIEQIKEIRAGAGDDIIDVTTQRFQYNGESLKIYGGLGNDTIWANNSNNILFGDAGSDRLVGGTNSNVFVGGQGDDSMYGCGTENIFCFGGSFGNDTIEFVGSGTIVLWFGDLTLNEITISYENNNTILTSKNGTITVENFNLTNDCLRFGAAQFSSEYDKFVALGAFSEESSTLAWEELKK